MQNMGIWLKFMSFILLSSKYCLLILKIFFTIPILLFRTRMMVFLFVSSFIWPIL
uniref:Uncharacterized protein n=1 Tax=Rhizophora mucronata TaxID=61149 RepID=A0A2P2P5B8_RHIMU